MTQISLLFAGSLIGGGLSLFFLTIGLLAYHSPSDPQLKIYNERLQYMNYFLPWDKIQSLKFPLKWEVSRRLNQLRNPALLYKSTKTLRIQTEDNVYLVPIMHVQKLKDTIKQLGKEKLWKESNSTGHT